MKLKGKTVLITGASKGVGREIALLFASEGCNLILNARGKEQLEKVKKECESLNISCKIVSGDITSSETLSLLEKSAEETTLDILVNNAGIMIAKPVEENTEDDTKKIFYLNVFAQINLTQRLLPLLKSRTEAQIINMVSNSGLEGRQNLSLYCSTKFALRGYTDSLRKEVNKYGIKVLGIYPGGMRTNLFDKIENHDISGFMDPKEVARIVVSSCKISKDASVDDVIINRTNK